MCEVANAASSTERAHVAGTHSHGRLWALGWADHTIWGEPSTARSSGHGMYW